MTLDEVIPSLLALLAADPTIKAAEIKPLDQTDADYRKDFETAIKTRGLVITALLANGAPADNPALRELDLQNTVIVAVVENPVTNSTEAGIHTWLTVVLAAIQQAPHSGRGPRPFTLAPDQPYEIGPMSTGLNMYFINVRVRSLDELPA